jgi:hypothetical protein
LSACDSAKDDDAAAPAPATKGAPAPAVEGTTPAIATVESRQSASNESLASQSPTPVSAAPSARPGTIADPSGDELIALAYSVSGAPSPIETWVEKKFYVGSPLDGSKDREKARAEYTGLMQSVADVGYLQIEIDGELSEYDSTYQEFYLPALNSTSYFSQSGTMISERANIRFSNGTKAQVWPVPAEQLQTIIEKVRGGNMVRLALTLQVEGAMHADRQHTIKTRVVAYDIFSRNTGQKLGSVAVP